MSANADDWRVCGRRATGGAPAMGCPLPLRYWVADRAGQLTWKKDSSGFVLKKMYGPPRLCNVWSAPALQDGVSMTEQFALMYPASREWAVVTARP